MTDEIPAMHELMAAIASQRPGGLSVRQSKTTGELVGIDPEVFGAAVGNMIREELEKFEHRLGQIEAKIDQIQMPGR